MQESKIRGRKRFGQKDAMRSSLYIHLYPPISTYIHYTYIHLYTPTYTYTHLREEVSVEESEVGRRKRAHSEFAVLVAPEGLLQHSVVRRHGVEVGLRFGCRRFSARFSS